GSLFQGTVLFDFSFFFSSRRRHTRFSRDWSSDVCSSDLTQQFTNNSFSASANNIRFPNQLGYDNIGPNGAAVVGADFQKWTLLRSEERRVGKECRSRGAPCR